MEPFIILIAIGAFFTSSVGFAIGRWKGKRETGKAQLEEQIRVLGHERDNLQKSG